MIECNRQIEYLNTNTVKFLVEGLKIDSVKEVSHIHMSNWLWLGNINCGEQYLTAKLLIFLMF